MKEEYADQYRANRTYTRPDSISCTYWQTLSGLCQQAHTNDCKNKKSGNPSPPREPFN